MTKQNKTLAMTVERWDVKLGVPHTRSWKQEVRKAAAQDNGFENLAHRVSGAQINFRAHFENSAKRMEAESVLRDLGYRNPAGMVDATFVDGNTRALDCQLKGNLAQVLEAVSEVLYLYDAQGQAPTRTQKIGEDQAIADFKDWVSFRMSGDAPGHDI